MRIWMGVLVLIVGLRAPASAQELAGLLDPAFVAVRVDALAEAAAWYQRVFELTEVNRIDTDDVSIRILSSAGLSVELIERPTDVRPGGTPLGLFKTGLFVRDIDRVVEILRGRDVDTDDRVFTDEALRVRSIVLRDPEGNRLQLFERCGAECG